MRSEAEILANRYTPPHNFDLKTPEGRAARIAQLTEAMHEHEEEHRRLEAQASVVFAQLRALSKRHAWEFKKYGTERWAYKVDWDLLVRWRSAPKKANRLRSYIRAMKKADANAKSKAEIRRQRKLIRDRERAARPSAKERRRLRDKARPPLTPQQRDARNARRRARYQLLKETPQGRARRDARNARDRARYAARKGTANARRRARYAAKKTPK